MDADLVSAAGFETTAQQASQTITKHTLHAIAGACGLAALADDRHALTVAQITPDVATDRALAWTRHAPGHGSVGAGDAVGGKLGREGLMGRVGLGRDHQSAGLLVEPVHDAGTAHTADSRKRFTAMGEQGVDQGAVGIARGRVHHKTRGLVDHDQRLVFVDHDKRNGLRFGHCRGRRRHAECNRLPLAQRLRGVRDRSAVDGSMPAKDQRLDAAARHLRQAVGQIAVEPLAWRTLGNRAFVAVAISHGRIDIGYAA